MIIKFRFLTFINAVFVVVYMNKDYKTLGWMLIGFAVGLLIILAFVKRDYDSQATFLCERFQADNLDMKECPAHTSNTSWYITVAFGIAFLVLGIGAYLLFMPKQLIENVRKQFKPVDLTKLKDDEKKIYEIAKGKGGSVFQTDLIKETGFSKVKITRILDRLENDDVVERKRRGMTNIIVLK